jgi:hypothetical protein
MLPSTDWGSSRELAPGVDDDEVLAEVVDEDHRGSGVDARDLPDPAGLDTGRAQMLQVTTPGRVCSDGSDEAHLGPERGHGDRLVAALATEGAGPIGGEHRLAGDGQAVHAVAHVHVERANDTDVGHDCRPIRSTASRTRSQ